MANYSIFSVLMVCLLVRFSLSLPFPQEPIVVVTPNVETDSTHPTPTTPPVQFNYDDIEQLYENAVVIIQLLSYCKSHTVR